MMQTVGQNDYLLEQVYTLMATHVVGPISVMVNELNRRGNVAAGGIEEFSKINDMLPSTKRRFRPSYEIAMTARAKAARASAGARQHQSADIINGTMCSPILGTR